MTAIILCYYFRGRYTVPIKSGSTVDIVSGSTVDIVSGSTVVTMLGDSARTIVNIIKAKINARKLTHHNSQN